MIILIHRFSQWWRANQLWKGTFIIYELGLLPLILWSSLLDGLSQKIRSSHLTTIGIAWQNSWETLQVNTMQKEWVLLQDALHFIPLWLLMVLMQILMKSSSFRSKNHTKYLSLACLLCLSRAICLRQASLLLKGSFKLMPITLSAGKSWKILNFKPEHDFLAIKYLKTI